MAILKQFECFNLRLALGCTLIAISSFNYGFDNQAFASTQAMDSFTREFGVFSPKKKAYVLEPSWLSLFNSLNYIGFAAGKCVVWDPPLYRSNLNRRSYWKFHCQQVRAAMVHVRDEHLCTWHGNRGCHCLKS